MGLLNTIDQYMDKYPVHEQLEFINEIFEALSQTKKHLMEISFNNDESKVESQKYIKNALVFYNKKSILTSEQTEIYNIINTFSIKTYEQNDEEEYIEFTINIENMKYHMQVNIFRDMNEFNLNLKIYNSIYCDDDDDENPYKNDDSNELNLDGNFYNLEDLILNKSKEIETWNKKKLNFNMKYNNTRDFVIMLCQLFNLPYNK